MFTYITSYLTYSQVKPYAFLYLTSRQHAEIEDEYTFLLSKISKCLTASFIVSNIIFFSTHRTIDALGFNLPTDGQASLLLETMEEANTVCDAISEVAWQEKIFNNFKLHHKVYHSYKATFQLSSQMLIRQIAKVADAYKLDKKTKRAFKPLGSIAYDSRIMTYSQQWGECLKMDLICL